ncbi:pyruvate kinase [Candidatus Saccharibacteria bacterium]|nr:pyruvate kinase [Candidatus Saccharibacteria bacterium]
MKIDATLFKKTKIIATVGPATEDKIEDLLAAGVNGIRLNFSHGTHTSHLAALEQARAAAKKLDRSVAIIADLQGPKIQVGSLPAGGVEISAGQQIKFQHGADFSKTSIIPIQYDFSAMVAKGEPLYLRDGQIKTVIRSVKKGVVVAEAQNSGKLMSNQGINLPETHFSASVLTKKDRQDIDLGVSKKADYIALSFVQTAASVHELRKILASHKSTTKIITKIETRLAVENLEEIVKASDAVMIARGDLAIETASEEVPIIGREIILLARKYKKIVIMATQMLEGMMNSTQPTRAEANDVATAVSLGVDCVMLSGETAIGKFPIETVQTMKRIILRSEKYFVATSMAVETTDSDETELNIEGSKSLVDRVAQKTKLIFTRELTAAGKISTDIAQKSISLSAITLAEQLRAKLIVAETLSGSTALSLASLRPSAPVVIASPHEVVCNQLALLWGGKPFLVGKNQRGYEAAIKKMKSRGAVKDGDFVVTAYGKQHNVAGGTDTIRLLEVK